jgi:hypothetical protein
MDGGIGRVSMVAGARNRRYLQLNFAICSVDNIACAELLKPPRLKCDYEIAASTGFTILSIETRSLPE